MNERREVLGIEGVLFRLPLKINSDLCVPCFGISLNQGHIFWDSYRVPYPTYLCIWISHYKYPMKLPSVVPKCCLGLPLSYPFFHFKCCENNMAPSFGMLRADQIKCHEISGLIVSQELRNSETQLRGCQSFVPSYWTMVSHKSLAKALCDANSGWTLAEEKTYLVSKSRLCKWKGHIDTTTAYATNSVLRPFGISSKEENTHSHYRECDDSQNLAGTLSASYTA
jgi:hypothetical protein